MYDLKQDLLRRGVAPELLAGWEDHQQRYDGPLITPDLLVEAMGLIELTPEAWAAVRAVFRKCLENEQYGRILWQLHLLLLGGQSCPTLSTGMWETLQGYLGDDYPCMGAVLFISWIPGMQRLYERMGVGLDVMKATLSDLAIWMRDYHRKRGHWGVSELCWLVRHPAGRLFRLGRLQFAPGECPFHARLYDNGEKAALLTDPNEPAPDKPGYRLIAGHGTPVVEVHIPEDGRMDIAECTESLHRAMAFFGRHFPGKYSVFQLETWFFDPQLDGLLPPESNIVRFQRMFPHRFPEQFGEGDCLNRVFGSPVIDPTTAPRDTTLRRAILDHMAKGGHMGGGAGFLLFREVENSQALDRQI